LERGFATFVEVGHALLEINSSRLYRAAGHRTFADYLATRWGMSPSHAYRQIEAARVIDVLSPIGDTPLPAHEAQARELVPLVGAPDALREVWQQVIDETPTRHATARAIRARVAVYRSGDRRTTRTGGAGAGSWLVCPECGHRWQPDASRAASEARRASDGGGADAVADGRQTRWHS
jgi:hypothetical protein